MKLFRSNFFLLFFFYKLKSNNKKLHTTKFKCKCKHLLLLHVQAVEYWNKETKETEEKERRDLKLNFPLLTFYVYQYFHSKISGMAYLHLSSPKSNTLLLFHPSVGLKISFFGLDRWKTFFLFCRSGPAHVKTHLRARYKPWQTCSMDSAISIF